MSTKKAFLLTMNGGSSTIKFALYQMGEPLSRVLHGKIDKTDQKDSKITFSMEKEGQHAALTMEVTNDKSPAEFLIDWLEKQEEFSSVKAVGHRLVHGMNHTEPEAITQNLINELHRIIPYDPDHLPNELDLIETFRYRHPGLLQVACFDTAFHSDMPRVAKMLPIPRRFDALGIRRYGFHGLSYAYLMEELARTAGTKASQGRIILAHLGNGASMAAVREGKSIDTSMGFTPASGFMMGTRPGDLDPGVAWYLMQSENLTTEQFNHLINQEAGLFGISETSSDMRDLLAQEANDIRAAEAVALFCYQAKKWIGAYAAALGGLDTLVFSGGMGENAPVIRSRICEGLGFLGIELEEKRNEANAPVISPDSGQTTVRVMHTNEEWMMAKTVSKMIKKAV